MKTHDARHATRNLPEIPAAFLERMERLLGGEYPAFLASYAEHPSVGLRVNTLKIAPETFRLLAPFELAPVPWCAAGFTIIGDDVEAGKHPFHAAGLYYLQDPSAMAVIELLDPQPGERVLDLASAPGGKATHIAAKMQGQGLLVANEIHPKRAWELAGNLERWGAMNVAITNETPERLAERFAGLLRPGAGGRPLLRRGDDAQGRGGARRVGAGIGARLCAAPDNHPGTGRTAGATRRPAGLLDVHLQPGGERGDGCPLP